MVVALGPGKFYGSSLPRPRFYSDVKFNDARVDPPMPVLEPLLSWAHDAHWSMGGLSFQRHRLQGKIEGTIARLRFQEEHSPRRAKIETKSTDQISRPALTLRDLPEEEEEYEEEHEEQEGEKEEQQEKEVEAAPVSSSLRKRARKLSDEFDKVATTAALPQKSIDRSPPRKRDRESQPETIGRQTRSTRRLDQNQKDNNKEAHRSDGRKMKAKTNIRRK